MAHILHASATGTQIASVQIESTHDPTFQPFPRLPTELRANIWAFSLSNEPTIPSTRLFTHIHTISHDLRIRSPRISLLFHVSREARYEAVRIDGGVWYPLGVGNVQLYVNFEKDIVYLYDCCDSWLDSRVDRRFVRPSCTREHKAWSHSVNRFR
jgi:hypothetical protein